MTVHVQTTAQIRTSIGHTTFCLKWARELIILSKNPTIVACENGPEKIALKISTTSIHVCICNEFVGAQRSQYYLKSDNKLIDRHYL